MVYATAYYYALKSFVFIETVFY